MALGDGVVRDKKPKKRKVSVNAVRDPAMMTLQEKFDTKEMRELIADLEKTYGADQVYGGDRPIPNIQVVPTGIYDLDVRCIGGGDPTKGGIPRGYVTEIFGPESGGKTTFCLRYIAQCQKLGLKCAFVDLEKSFDPKYAAAIGVDLSNFLYLIPMNGTEAAEMSLKLIEAKIDLIVLDSFGEMHSEDQVGKEITDNRIMGDSTNLVNKLLIKLAEPLFVNKNIFIVINQVRAKLNAQPWQKQTDTTGGWKAKHKFGLRMEINKDKDKIKKMVKGKEVVLGIYMKVQIIKNKIGPPLRITKIPLMFGEGISVEMVLLEDAIRMKIIEKGGSWFSYQGERIGQGKETAVQFLKDNPQICEYIQEKVYGVIAEQDDSELMSEAPDDYVESDGDISLE